MVNKNDKWSALSMKERADLIKLYVSNGVTSLNDIKKDYNSFAPGGPIDTSKWKALDNVDFKAIPDSTYTREKTGIGSIEFFHKDNLDGITYPNGYFREHPSPGENVILYDPKTNDEQDIRLDALHVMPQDPVYADLLAMYRLAANDGDVAHQADRDYKYYVDTYGMDKALKTFDAKDPQQLWERLFDNAADGLLRNMLIEGTPEYIESKRYYPNKQQLREWNSHLVPYIDEIQKYLETGERPWYMLEPAVVTAEAKKANGGKLNNFDDGGIIDTSIPLKSRQQYLEQQRQQIIDAAIQNSYDREFPEIPHTLKFQNENKWREYMESKINEANNLIENAPYEGMAEIYRERLRGLEAELAKGYTPELCEGPTCIYTTTGNFGKQYQVAGNRSFRGNPEKYGFVEIGLNEIKPGDVIQDFSHKDGIPTHALMFVGFDSNGKALYNYSDGRRDESAIQKDAYYPFINSSVHLNSQNNDNLKHAAAAYRFVGNEEDNINWNNDFVNYRKNYTDAVTKELKQVPKLQLPVFLENNNLLKLK
jgi:hypothetical protein